MQNRVTINAQTPGFVLVRGTRGEESKIGTLLYCRLINLCRRAVGSGFCRGASFSYKSRSRYVTK